MQQGRTWVLRREGFQKLLRLKKETSPPPTREFLQLTLLSSDLASREAAPSPRTGGLPTNPFHQGAQQATGAAGKIVSKTQTPLQGWNFAASRVCYAATPHTHLFFFYFNINLKGWGPGSLLLLFTRQWCQSLPLPRNPASWVPPPAPSYRSCPALQVNKSPSCCHLSSSRGDGESPTGFILCLAPPRSPYPAAQLTKGTTKRTQLGRRGTSSSRWGL